MMRLAENLTETGRLLHNIVKVGDVSAVDPESGKMRLFIDDNETDWVKIPSMACGALKVWRCPSLGERFACICESGNLGNAIAVTALTSDDNQHQSKNPDEVFIDFGTGTFALNMADGSAVLSLTKLKIDCPDVHFTGIVSADKEITSHKDVIAEKISLKSHLHGQVQSGSGLTGDPQ